MVLELADIPVICKVEQYQSDKACIDLKHFSTGSIKLYALPQNLLLVSLLINAVEKASKISGVFKKRFAT